MSFDEAVLDPYSRFSALSVSPDLQSLHPVDIVYLDNRSGYDPKLSSDRFHLGPYAHRQNSVSTMESANSEEMETFQRLSDQYQPDVHGPLIGHKLPSSALVTEYAHADPTYQTKTAALSATYSHYRPVRGDGQCGWRAAVFGYFEQLLQVGDPAKITEVIAFLNSFNDYLPAAGFEIAMVEMFMESAMELLEKMHEALQRQELDGTILLDTMTNEEESNTIVFYFKILTSTFMQLNADQFQPFLEMSVQEYCKTKIEAHAQEIEQASLQALTTGIISKAGIAVEVLYLDRSQGDEVTPHAFVPDAESWPTIRLLYRPGHYDMIYKSSQPYQVQFLPQAMPAHNPYDNSSHDNYNSYEYNDTMSHLFPNFTRSRATGTDQWSQTAHNHIDLSNRYVNSASSYQHIPLYGTYHTQDYSSPAHTASSPMLIPPPSEPMPQSPSPSLPFPHSTGSFMSPPEHPSDAIRMSIYVKKFEGSQHHPVPLETSPFKNSQYNPAHFHNSEFQPMLWKAEEEYGKS